MFQAITVLSYSLVWDCLDLTVWKTCLLFWKMNPVLCKKAWCGLVYVFWAKGKHLSWSERHDEQLQRGNCNYDLWEWLCAVQTSRSLPLRNHYRYHIDYNTETCHSTQHNTLSHVVSRDMFFNSYWTNNTALKAHRRSSLRWHKQHSSAGWMF